MADLIQVTTEGLACEPGGFHVDPWLPVSRAIITHAHADHARPGNGEYWCASPGEGLLRIRLGPEAVIHAVPYGTRFSVGECTLSFHPAGHVLGSAQIRVEHDGEVWVVSGDYKRHDDPTCAPFEVVPCDVFITEATFALPIYAWERSSDVMKQIHAWWQGNAAAGHASIIFCYALGKAQRILSGLHGFSSETVLLHGAVDNLLQPYRDAGVPLLPTRLATTLAKKEDVSRALVLAPPSAAGTPWMRRFGDSRTAFASGWMRVRAQRRRRGDDMGFVLSDHADWPSLLRTIEETGAKRVLATHGHSHALVRFLQERGVDAAALETAFEGEADI